VWGVALRVGAAQEPRLTPPDGDGVYTSQQADRGRDEYTTGCAHCHSSDLLGDVRLEIPSLAEDDFFVRWGGRTAAELFKVIRTDMPADKPGKLTTQAYVDILAYILQVNRFPAGSNELRADSTQLDEIVFAGRR
jgi:cytochrome c